MKKTILHTIVATLSMTLISWSWLNAQENSIFVFVHANVLPMTSEIVLPDHSVLIRNGKIEHVGPSSNLKIPEGATIINATGKYLIPGLSDMHVHLEGDAWNIMYPPGSGFTAEEIDFNDILFMYVANGVTLVDVLFAFPEHLPIREKIRNSEMIGPRLILSRMIDGAGRAWPPPLGVWINNSDEAKVAVTKAHEEGYDRIKVYSFLDRESYDTIIATAKNLQMPVDGHVPFATSVEHVLSSGQSMIAHVEEIMKFAKGYTPEQIGYFADITANSNVWVTSSLILNKNLNTLLRDSAGQFSKSGIEYLHPMGLGIWTYVYTHIYNPIPEKGRTALVDGYDRFQRPFTLEFYRRGGKLLTGTDALVPSTLPALSLHEELEELVDVGLSPFAALRATTTNPYEFLGESTIGGTIERGKIANLVLLEKNPLEKISNTKTIAGVMTGKRWISQDDIANRLREIRSSYSNLRKRKSEK